MSPIIDSAPQTALASRRWFRPLCLTVILALALAVRARFLSIETLDYQNFLSRWYSTLDEQGWSAFRQTFADYNYPYLYLLLALTWVKVPALIGVKIIAIAADILLATFAYRIVGLRSERFAVRAAAFALVLFLPSVVANSAWWGQADAIYSAFTFGALFYLLRGLSRGTMRRDAWLACIFFGVAVSFKLQAVFILPVLVWLVLRGSVRWYTLSAIPLTYLVLDIPALIAGAPVSTIWSVYLSQTGANKQLTMGAANVFQLFSVSGDAATTAAHVGIALAFLAVAGFLAWSVWKRPVVTATNTLVVACLSGTVVPFLLPNMHDRYFYTVEVLSVVLAFYLPLRFAVIPVLMQLSAMGIYYSSLTGDQGNVRTGGTFGGPGGAPGGRPMGGPGGGHGAPGGGHGPGGRPGGSGYSSGRGDGLLTACAVAMGLAIMAQFYAMVHVFRRPRAERESAPLTTGRSLAAAQ